jgi:hypothetical protein
LESEDCWKPVIGKRVVGSSREALEKTNMIDQGGAKFKPDPAIVANFLGLSVGIANANHGVSSLKDVAKHVKF